MAVVSQSFMLPGEDRADSLLLPDFARYGSLPDMLRGLSGCLQQDPSLDLAHFMPSISGALAGLEKGSSLALLFNSSALPPCGELPMLLEPGFAKSQAMVKPSVSPLNSCSANSTQEVFEQPATTTASGWTCPPTFSISPFAAIQQPVPPPPQYGQVHGSRATHSGPNMSERPSSSNDQGMESSSMDRSKPSDASALHSMAESEENQDLPGIRRSAREATRASTMATVKRSKAPKEKKKVGRPIAYTGDPNAPHLSEAERRRVKRRIANRESARRVRMRRMEQVDELVLKMNAIKDNNEQLQNVKVKMDAQLDEMRQQVAETNQQWQKLELDNQQLQQNIEQLHTTLTARMSELKGGRRATWNQTSPSPPAVVTGVEAAPPSTWRAS